jgi:hypothetical protein
MEQEKEVGHLHNNLQDFNPSWNEFLSLAGCAAPAMCYAGTLIDSVISKTAPRKAWLRPSFSGGCFHGIIFHGIIEEGYPGIGVTGRRATVRINRLTCRPPATAVWRLVKSIKHTTPRSGPKAIEQSKRSCQYWEELRCQC